MKSNDQIPADEMLLAEAIAAAKANRLGWIGGSRFYPETQNPHTAVRCCVEGALVIAGRIKPNDYFGPTHLNRAYIGNDCPGQWSLPDVDRGESLGWAFRCAMEES
jgi:hypothetical protein